MLRQNKQKHKHIKPMLVTITCIITLLIAVNFFLLFFSSNKTTKTKASKPVIIHPEVKIINNKLAATGS